MRVFLLLLFTCSSVVTYSQLTDKLKIFLDCESCDENFIRSEINILDFVTDRVAADIHILVTSTNNGNGGQNYQLVYYGQKRFKNKTDKVLFTIPANATGLEIRAEVTKRLKLGLVPFIIHTPYSAFINIDMKLPDTSSKKLELPSVHTEDKWNYWVFRLGSDATFSTDEVYKSAQISGNISANKITDEKKIHLSLQTNYNHSSYKYDDNGTTKKYKVDNSNYAVNYYNISSIESNWSLGYEAGFSKSTFSNNKSKIFVGGGVEYAIIPYKQISTKSFTVSYNWQISHFRYYDTTIYNKTSEILPGQRLDVNLSLKEKWGHVNGGIAFSNYFENFSLNNLSANLSLNLRVTGGIFFYMYFTGALVHDQISLPKGRATEQEILSRRRQIASSYNFYSGAGVSYRFGSILNNYVNPRFSIY